MATYNVLIPIYKDFNTLDVCGPLDVLCNTAIRTETGDSRFKITIAAEEDLIQGWEHLTVKPDCTILPKVKDGITYPDCANYRASRGEYDILMIPGAGSTKTRNSIKDMLDPYITYQNQPLPPIVQLIRTFLSTDNADPNKQKWLVSICTGGLIAGAAGAFVARKATTHFGALDRLKYYCDAYKHPAESIVRKRWVDGGMNNKTRILSSGGISCGIDASLWLVAQTLGDESALKTAQWMDYPWPFSNYTPYDLPIGVYYI